MINCIKIYFFENSCFLFPRSSWVKTSCPVASVLFGSVLTDTLTSLDTSGSMLITSLETGEPINALEHEFLYQMYPFHWGKLVLGPDEMSVRVALRKCALVLDTRVGRVVNSTYEVDLDNSKPELITDLVPSGNHSHQAYCLTSHSLHLCDERMPKRTIFSQSHLQKELPRGDLKPAGKKTTF